MLKGFYSLGTSFKADNVILLSFLRRNFHWSEMQNETRRKYHNNKKFFDNNKPNVNDLRKWVPVAAQPKKTGHYFSVLDYNILSQQLLDDHQCLYKQHTKESLKWNQRFSNLVGEITYNNPDILCCQVNNLRSLNFIDVICNFLSFKIFLFSGSSKIALVRHPSEIEIVEL